MHVLGTARSFRTGSLRSQITHGEAHYLIHGQLRTRSQRRRDLGVQRHANGDTLLRIAGETARSSSRLADELPLLLLNAASFDLLAGEPANRRRFLDWGVFHVKHEQREHRRRFQRALTQRNHLLRRGKLKPVELAPWNQELALHGEALTAARCHFLRNLAPLFERMMADLAPEIGSVAMAYRPGWDSSLSYAEVLARGEESDRQQGYTQSGPQRADVRVTVDGRLAADTLSRGQQKLLIAMLTLAQGQLLAKEQASVLYLIDDLPSELDRGRCERVCHLLRDIGAQTLVTCVDKGSLSPDWLGEASQVALFHVKQGVVAAVPSR